MKLFEGKTPAERNKLIAAIVLGAIAFISIAYMLFGFGSSPSPQNRNANANRATQTAQNPTDVTATQTTTKLPSPSQVRVETENLAPPTKIIYDQSTYNAPEAGRNIFAFYEKPPAPVKPPPTPPPPTPTPTPPLTLASLSPVNVFARTSEFTLEVSGDKFTPASAIVIDNNPLPTRYINAQQLSATVPAAMIANDGARQIKVSTPDGALYSNTMPLMVTPPPVPNYLYIGIIG
ncbi:MAG: hypothetical protein JOZ52_11200, partial [Acidobacteria bacterium]|nr:hypothetical protein [Acidobacteriota bacterium]